MRNTIENVKKESYKRVIVQMLDCYNKCKITKVL